MNAMVLEKSARVLRLSDVPIPKPNAGELLIKVHVCGVCRTDLHIIDGDLAGQVPQIIPGHEIVGEVEACGEGAEHLKIGDRVGVPWLGWTCGECVYCRSGRENLCDRALFTGYTIDGGYAEYVVANEKYCFSIPDFYSDREAAPLLCAGLIGYRSLRATGDPARIGLYGFGASAHIIAQVAAYEGRKVFAFTHPGDAQGQAFARSLGATWTGDSNGPPPEPLDAAIIFAPVGALIPEALKAVAKGGRVISAGIHMTDIPSFPYGLLWGERSVGSVANLTRRDGEEFLRIAPKVPVRASTELFSLARANQALSELRAGHVHGAAVLEVVAPSSQYNGRAVRQTQELETAR